MLKLRDGIVELYRKVATSIPPDIEEALRQAHTVEEDPAVKGSLAGIIEEILASRRTARPVCHDTGVPTFLVRAPKGLSHIGLRQTIREATVIATEKIPLKPNAVDVLTGENSGNNTGVGYPIIYLDETADDTLRIDLLLKGSGCENVGQFYRLPIPELDAGMDLQGVRRCVLNAVADTKGRGCPPYVLGIGIGAEEDQVSVLAKRQFFRRLSDANEHPLLEEFEQGLLDEINRLGFTGKTTAIGVKVGIGHHHPSSYYVNVSVSCWANRRARLIW